MRDKKPEGETQPAQEDALEQRVDAMMNPRPDSGKSKPAPAIDIFQDGQRDVLKAFSGDQIKARTMSSDNGLATSQPAPFPFPRRYHAPRL